MSRKPEPIAEIAPARPLPVSLPFRTAALASRKPTRFKLEPDGAGRAAIAAELGLIDLPALRIKGEIAPAGARDFLLTARLEADVVQPCSVTLAPVAARIAEDVIRRYSADFAEPEGEEAEMPEDDSLEPLPEVIDIGAVLIEALALALPLYPRAEGVELGEVSSAPPGAEPIREADIRPFAGLAALRDKLAGPEGQE